MTSYRFAPTTYLPVLALAQEGHEKIRESTTPWSEFVTWRDVDWYLAEDYLSGFGVSDSGELLGVFSVVKGRGDELVQAAVERGAWHLDCFDGYLTSLYGRNGFVVTDRQENWTPGGPDVVWMERLTGEPGTLLGTLLDLDPTGESIPDYMTCDHCGGPNH